MSEFKCTICDLEFKTSKTLNAHMKSQRHLRNMNSNNLPLKNVCVCGKKYKYRQGLYTHRKICTYSVTHTEPIEQQVEYLKTTIEEERRIHEEELRAFREEHEELKGQLNTLLDKFAEHPPAGNKTSIENQTNIGNQNNVTINVNSFGNENLDYITEKVMSRAVGRIYNSIPVLIEKIHFDPKHPENRNIKITNRKLPYASVMSKTKKWKTMDKQEAIETMINKSYTLLDTTYEDNKDDFTPFAQRRFEEFQDKYVKQDKETMRNVRKKVEIAILNGSS